MIQRYLLLWLVISSAAAYYWPELSLQSHLPPSLAWFYDPFAQSGASLPYLIALTMLAIGVMLPRDEVSQVLQRWPTVFAGTALQYTVMPALALAMGLLWRLEGNLLVGMVMVGCVPGAMASNVLTLNARGNTSYSVSLTTSATLLSPIAVPLVMGIVAFFLQADGSIDRGVLINSSIMLLVTVVLPVIAGHLLARWLPPAETLGTRFGSALANLVILWIIAVVVGRNRDALSQFQYGLLGALLMVNLGGYAAGYFGGRALRLPEPMRRALTLEIGMQNAGLGATLATSLFPGTAGSEIAIAPAMYTFGCMLTGTMLARLWAKTSQAKVPATTPSPIEDEPIH